MEATQKTSITKAALLVIAALSMLLSGLFIATASRSDASPPPACPDGFSLTADAKNCFQASVLTSADNPNSCEKGQLTPDGSKCYVPARVLTQEGSTLCPDGYSQDSSTNMCTRFVPAVQGDPTCSATSLGTAGSCFIYVAKGPAGDAECNRGELVGSNCVITGPAPTRGVGSCPVSDTVFEDAGGCFRLVSAIPAPAPCGATGYTLFPASGTCKLVNPNENDPVLAFNFSCPATLNGQTVTAVMNPAVTNAAGVAKVASCNFPATGGAPTCPANTVGPDANGQCRGTVDLLLGALSCTTGFGLVGNECIAYEAPTNALASCPIGSVEDSDGNCRKPVSDKDGEFFCADAAAALNGKSCVFTTGFIAVPAPNLYKCDEGDRTVIGSGSAVQIICILGDAADNLTSAETCLQGVLSTDKQYCIVPRIDTAPAAAVAAPVPSFTG